MLICNGYSLTADGQFGPNTESQLKAYQKAKGLVVDGYCGADTWKSFFKK